MLKRPASFVSVTRSVFVESWTRRTVAPGNLASLESVTVPVIEPRPDCAYVPTLNSMTSAASRMPVYISDSSCSRPCLQLRIWTADAPDLEREIDLMPSMIDHGLHGILSACDFRVK